ncbi:hypothetical protein [Marinobacter xestospongiae]|uniref:Uncharacterized protein n=1 Tax=Marinobacter xestospongiae TaxID=994319 RepID=A0ABU3VZP1_9GAMM|nr:hypothetical protein [Marinobacter xestospongiae]MDV2079580.1 hypothetical protein [Marinobacter xestospongiae]
MLFINKEIERGLLVGTALLMSGCFNADADSPSEQNIPDPQPAHESISVPEDQADSSPERPSEYTADLSIFGPHPETSVKQTMSEPRYMELSMVEKQKVSACTMAKGKSTSLSLVFAQAEFQLDGHARLEERPRTIPLGDAAKERFREHISRLGQPWPIDAVWGRYMTQAMAEHVGFKYWKDYYDANASDLSSGEKRKRTDALWRTMREEIWSLCINNIPTACFESGDKGGRCLEHAITLEELPGYEVVSDIYTGG